MYNLALDRFYLAEDGNVWLDKLKTSPYKFYQFWLNISDADAKNYIKIFTLKDKKEIKQIINEHEANPHLRLLQNAIASEVTSRVHSKEDLEMAIKASKILFGKSTSEDLKSLDEETFLSIFEGVPQFKLEIRDIELGILDILSEKTKIFTSKGETRRMIKSSAVSINKEKITEVFKISNKHLLNGKYLLVQKGKKNYYIIIIS